MSVSQDKHRRSLRLKGYNYTQAGVYFITICSHQRQCLFGEICDGQMQLNESGQIIQASWEALPERFPSVCLDTFVVMPNHLHGILCLIEQPVVHTTTDALCSPHRASTREYSHPQGTESNTLGRVVQAFKSITTYQYTQGVKHKGWPPFEDYVWQRNYYEHIIRQETALNSIREYINANPKNWTEDAENPLNV